MAAAQGGHASCVQLLLDRSGGSGGCGSGGGDSGGGGGGSGGDSGYGGAVDAAMVNAQDSPHGASALMLAAKNGHAAAVGARRPPADGCD
eukprot:5619763-Prymnesium_polylepis.1